MSSPEYVTDDGFIRREGDLVYDYYGMEPIIIGAPEGSAGWFMSMSAEDPTKRSKSGMLNGSRICTLATAQDRNFPRCR